jgi:hypothetical protein
LNSNTFAHLFERLLLPTPRLQKVGPSTVSLQWGCTTGNAATVAHSTKTTTSGKDSVIEGRLCSGLVTELLAYIHTIILMCYNKKCSEKGAFSGHIIQLSIKTLTSKFGK